MISKEQAIQIKQQLIEQINNSNLENKQEILEYISRLNESELEEFLEKQGVTYKTNQKSSETKIKSEDSLSQENSCVFCLITKNKISSYKLDETKDAIAVLEINPFSKGHSLIIPVQHTTTEKLPTPVLSLAKKIAKKIKTKLKPQEIKIETFSLKGHTGINVIPIYKNIELKQKTASEEELKELQNKLKIKKRQTKPKTKLKIKETSEKKLPKLSFRIPN
jgi:histidine triad (HIT) family protein